VRYRRKKFAFAISSPDEFLYRLLARVAEVRCFVPIVFQHLLPIYIVVHDWSSGKNRSSPAI